MKTKLLAALTCRGGVGSLPKLTALLWLALALPAAANSLQLGFTVPGSFNESNRQAVLEWNAAPAKTYLVQSADALSPGMVWKTEEPVRASGNGPIRWTAPEVLRQQKYYRLGLPQPEVCSVEPAFIDSSDPNALLYIAGQCLPTNGTVVINGQNFTPTLVDTNGGWVAISLNGLPPGTPIFGNILVLDNASNVVATLPLQSPVFYGPEMPAEQIQGPPEEPPSSPQTAYFSKRGYDYYKAKTDLNAAGLNTNPYFQENQNAGAMPHGRLSTGAIVGIAVGSVVGARAEHLVEVLEIVGHQINYALWGGGGGGGGSGGRKGLNAVNVKLAFSSGELECEEADLVVPGRGLDFAWVRTYRSRTGPTTAQGAGWDFSYNVSLTPQPDGTMVLRPGNGRADTFYPNGTNGWARDEYFVEVRDLNSDGMPDVLFADGGKWLFHPLGTAVGGKLWQIVDRNANTMTLEYDGAGQLASIVDDLDRTNTVAYNPVGQIASVTDFSGRMVRYEYDGNGDLIACISPAITGTPNGNDFPGGKTNRYTYSSRLADPRLNHNLTALTDPKGQPWLQVTYQATNNPTSPDFDAVSSLLRGIEKAQIKRGMVIVKPNTPQRMRAIVNDGVGNVCESDYDSRQRLVELREFTGRANPDLPTTATKNRPTGKLRSEDPDYFTTQFEWNPDSLCTRVVSPRGDSVEMVYERAFNQNEARTNRRHSGDLRIVREVACCDQDDDGDGLTDSLTTTFEYDPRFGSPATICGKKLYIGNLPFMESARGPRQTTSLDGSYDGGNAPGSTAKHWLPSNFRLEIGGLPLSRKGWDGTIKGNPRAKVITDRDTGRSKGFGCVTRTTDPRGNVTTASYDANGNITKATPWKHHDIQGLDAPTLEFAYNPYGQVTSITNAADANGYRRVDTCSYYGGGPQAGYLKACIVDASGLALATGFEWDARGNMIRVVDPRGYDTVYTYNALDQCVAASTPANATYPYINWSVELAYDANDNLVRCDEDNRNDSGTLDSLNPQWTTRYGFDAFDRCTEVVREVAEGAGLASYATNRFVYDANNNLIAIHSPLAVSGVDPNNFVQLEYDERNLLFRAIPAPGLSATVTNRWNYDANGHPSNTYIVEEIEFVIEKVERARFSQPTQITDAMSNVVTYAYDRNNNLTFARVDAEPNDNPGNAGNRRYHEWRWKYDALNQCVEARAEFFDPATQAPLGDGAAVTTFSYAPNGACTSVTDDNGHTTRYAYDTVGRLASVTDPKTNVVSYTYDECDNVLSITRTDRSDIAGGTQQFTVVNGYDRLHRLTRSVDNVGNTNLYAYDSRGHLVSQFTPREDEVVYSYDGLGNCTSTTNYVGKERGLTINTSHVEYDVNSRRTAVTDGNGNPTFYAYDARDRCVLITEADGTARSLVWSPRSNLVREQDANGTVISNRFDLLDRCVRRDIMPGPGVAATTTFELYAYDGLSQLVAAANDTTHNEFAYDSHGNRVAQTGNGLTTSCTFDGVGNPLALTYPSGRVVTYAYDALDQVSAMSSAAGGGPLVGLSAFAYDGPGRLGRITRANSVTSRYQWSGQVNPPNAPGDFGWMQVGGVNHQVAGNGPVIDRRISSYDRNQNKLTRAQTVPFYQGGDTTTNVFEYDPLDRLSRAIATKGTGATLRTYVLDGVGNRQLVISNGVAEPYLMAATIPPADFQMNQYTLTPFVVAPEQYDANGNLTGRTTATAQLQYVYDYADRLVAVNDLFTGLSVPVVSFSYDALGHRSSKTIYPSGLPPVTTEFVYDWRDDDCDGDIIEERVNGTLRRTYAVPHVFDQKGRVMFTDAGETFFFHTDELGNTLALTDASGAVVERCDYDDFGLPIFLSTDGLPTGETESGVGNPFLFHGMEWDAETRLYYDRGMSGENPFYDPQTGRAVRGKVKDIKDTGMGFAGNNPWSGGSPDAMTKGTVKFFNESKGFGRVGGSGGTKSQDHNSSRSNKSGIAAPNGGGGGGGGGTKAQDHNSSRSNKTASIAHPGGGGGGGGGGSKAQDHNSSRSNKSGLAGPGGGGGDIKVKIVVKM